jgi:thioredoxin 1
MVAYISELTNDNFNEFISDGYALVDIWASWCGPCKVISPIVDEISSDYYGKLKVGKLDADAYRDTVVSLGVRNIPTIFLYKDGQVVETSTGAVTKAKLIELINKNL